MSFPLRGRRALTAVAAGVLVVAGTSLALGAFSADDAATQLSDSTTDETNLSTSENASSTSGNKTSQVSSESNESQTSSKKSQSSSDDSDEAYRTGELVVTLSDKSANSSNSYKQIAARLARAGYSVSSVIAEADDSHGTIVKLSYDGNEDAESVADNVEKVKGVSSAQPNYIYKLADSETSTGTTEASSSSDSSSSSLQTLSTTVNDPYATDYLYSSSTLNQYYLYGTSSSGTTTGSSFTDAWDTAKSNQSVTVAVLDTGVYLDHPDLEDNLNTDLAYDVYNKTSLASEVDSSFCGDRIGHGTHVAGIIAAEANNSEGIAGTSYNAEILPIKVFDDDGSDPSTTTEVLVRACEYLEDCIDSGELDDLHVINMSLGGYGHEDGDGELENAIEDLYYDYDVVTVCAGGNGDDRGLPVTDYSYPADFDVCLSVTALNPDGTNATWSDFNDKKDISAPGVNIWSTWIPDSSSDVKEVDGAYYACADGTSMASPVVAGAVALCFAADPDATADEVVTAIKDTADDIDDSSDWFRRNSTGASGSAGALNAAAAVTEVTETTLTTSSATTASTTTTTKTTSTSSSTSTSSVSVGKSYTAGTGTKKASYLVKKKATSKSAGKVYYRKSLVSKKAKKATVPAKVKIKGKTYKVVGISKNAFSKRKKLRTITIKSPYLTCKKAVKGSLKGSKIATVKVSVTGKAKRAKVRAAFKKKAWVGRKVRVK